MVKVYYAKVSDFTESFNQSIDLLKHIPRVFQEEALRYVRVHDQFSFIIGRLLIIRLLRFFGFNAREITNLHRTEHDKPFIRNLLSFNISHSGDYVICCGSLKHKLGIDIEKKRQIDITDFKSAFSFEELEMINSDPTPIKAFYELWTKKESVIKADGRGLSLDLKNISIQENKAIIYKNNSVWHLKSININKDYSCHICSDEEISSLDIQEFQVHMI